MQAAGCEHQPRVTGGGKGSCETPGLTWVNTLLGNVKRVIDGTYHACSSRYSGRYLAEFGYCFNRCHQLVDLVPRLAYVAVRTPPLPYRLLLLWLELLGNQVHICLGSRPLSLLKNSGTRVRHGSDWLQPDGAS